MCRQEQFEKSAAGKAARAQLQGMAKQSANSNKGEPALKVLVIEMLIFTARLLCCYSNASCIFIEDFSQLLLMILLCTSS